MSKLKAQLAQLRNILSEMHILDIYPGVQLAVHKSTAQELVDSGAGGLLDIELSLALDPDGKHQYCERISASLNVSTDTLHIFSELERASDIDVMLELRSTWPTPAFEASGTYKLRRPANNRDLVRQLLDTVSAFARLHYRPLVNALHASGYFDATDWTCPVAIAFLEHLKVNQCPSAAA